MDSTQAKITMEAEQHLLVMACVWFKFQVWLTSIEVMLRVWMCPVFSGMDLYQFRLDEWRGFWCSL